MIKLPLKTLKYRLRRTLSRLEALRIASDETMRQAGVLKAYDAQRGVDPC